MELVLKHFFAATSRSHMSLARETGISRQRFEQWLEKDSSVYVDYDPRSEVVESVIERPLPRIHYKRGK